MTYTITPRHAPSAADVAVTAGVQDLRRIVCELSGRDVLGFKSCRDHLHRTGRLYVLTASGTCGRALFGRGFIIERDVCEVLR